VIAHVVLFRPRSDLTDAQRQAFVSALEHALVNITLIRRARVGRRFALGRQYDEQNAQDFPFAAILEFDDREALQEYLEHEAHRALGQQFYFAAESALAFDYELLEGVDAGRLLA
jgi:hypothetical protein